MDRGVSRSTVRVLGESSCSPGMGEPQGQELCQDDCRPLAAPMAAPPLCPVSTMGEDLLVFPAPPLAGGPDRVWRAQLGRELLFLLIILLRAH